MQKPAWFGFMNENAKTPTIATGDSPLYKGITKLRLCALEAENRGAFCLQGLSYAKPGRNATAV
jgi:hypothetical protein